MRFVFSVITAVNSTRTILHCSLSTLFLFQRLMFTFSFAASVASCCNSVQRSLWSRSESHPVGTAEAANRLQGKRKGFFMMLSLSVMYKSVPKSGSYRSSSSRASDVLGFSGLPFSINLFNVTGTIPP